MFEWTEERCAFLKERLEQGQTFGDIAAMLGASRSSCIGKASRLGLTLRALSEEDRKKRADMLKERQRQNSKIAIRKGKAAAKPAAPPADPLVAQDAQAKKGWPKPMTPTAIKFLKMPNTGRCRMPLWGDDTPMSERFYCGAEALPAKSYCPGCYRAAHDPNAFAAEQKRAS